LTPSILKHAGSSGGVLPTYYTKHLSLSQPESGQAYLVGPILRLEWGQEVTGGQLFHAVTLRPTGEAYTLSEEVLRRLLCHAIIAHLPENALSEASESLAGIYEYYRTLPPIQLPALPALAPVQAKWGERYESPTFRIDED
jgi:hypothetical protein